MFITKYTVNRFTINHKTEGRWEEDVTMNEVAAALGVSTVEAYEIFDKNDGFINTDELTIWSLAATEREFELAVRTASRIDQ